MGILQAKILEWVAMTSSRGSSQPRDRTQASHTAGGFFTIWATSGWVSKSSVSTYQQGTFLAMEDIAQGRLWHSAQPGPLPHHISLKLPLNFVPGPGVWDGTVLWISCCPGRIATGPWHIYSLPNWDTWQPVLPPPAGMPGIVLDCSCLFTAGNIFPGSPTMSKFLTSSLAGSNQA